MAWVDFLHFFGRARVIQGFESNAISVLRGPRKNFQKKSQKENSRNTLRWINIFGIKIVR